jgi:hypothetical protein
MRWFTTFSSAAETEYGCVMKNTIVTESELYLDVKNGVDASSRWPTASFKTAFLFGLVTLNALIKRCDS